MGKPITTGIACALLGVFPLAALVALIYRFPIPFVGYMSGLEAVASSLLAVLFYGVAGGFVVPAAIGAASGIAARLFADQDVRLERWLTLAFALAGDLVAVMFLANLDKLIGKW